MEAVGLGKDGVEGAVDLGRRLADSLGDGQANVPAGTAAPRFCGRIKEAIGSRLDGVGAWDRTTSHPDSIPRYAGMVASGKTPVHSGLAA
jgi:hypothetical protein